MRSGDMLTRSKIKME